MRVVHNRFYYQPRQNRVYSYVHAIACKINYQHTLKLSDCPHSGSVANLCSCKNGQASPGDFGGCLVNGVAKCNLCDPGWTLNHERTKCIRTCVYEYFHNVIPILFSAYVSFVPFRKCLHMRKWRAANRCVLQRCREMPGLQQRLDD